MSQSIAKNKTIINVKLLFIRFNIFLLIFSNFVSLSLQHELSAAAYLNFVIPLICASFMIFITVTALTFRTIKKIYLVALLITFIFIISIYPFGQFNVASLRYVRALLSPFVFGILFASLLNDQVIYIITTIKSIILFGFIVSLYGFYQYATITKISQFWFYYPLINEGYAQYSFDLFRNGYPRISSVFTSSLEFAFFNLNLCFLSLSLLTARIKHHNYDSKSVVLFIYIILFIAAIILSTVRSAQIALVVGVPYLFFVYNSRSRLSVGITGLLIAVGLPLIIFLYLYFGFTHELSAIGRLAQWHRIFEILKISPFGVGIDRIGPGKEIWFDSLWLNIIGGYGIFGFPLIILIFYFYKIILDQSFAPTNFAKRILLRSLLVAYPLFLANAFFQAFFNSTVLYILCIFCSIAVFKASQSGWRSKPVTCPTFSNQ